MKNYLSTSVILLAALIIYSCTNKVTAPDTSPKEITAPEKQVVKSSEQFGLELFKKINKNSGDKNIFISPFSVSSAFGMLLNGADGQTYTDIKSVLKLSGDTQDKINRAYKSLNNYLPSADPKVIFETANSIWYRNSYTFEQNFFDVNEKYFNSLIRGLDFSDLSSPGIINEWVYDKTHGKILKIIDRIAYDDVMFLINAIYFKGTWLYRFDSTATKQNPFYVSNSNSVNCMLMNQKDSLNYYSTDQYQAVELPYGNGDFKMLLILPASSNDINDFIDEMDENYWENTLNNMKKEEVNLWLPKFKLSYNIEMKNTLSDMGMGSIFNADLADLSKIRKEKDIYVTGVIHKTYINLDEEGTEAAAVTAIIVGRNSVGEGGKKEIFMRADHPFIFCIRENQTGAILFIGKVINPEEID